MKPKNETGLQTEVVMVTPSQAKEWLKLNVNNRRIRLSVVEEYAEDMLEKRWHPNGDTIKFNQDGNLCDGQHRLMACIVSETPFPTLVVHGVSDSAVITIDNNARRSTADYLYLSGTTDKKNAAAFAHVARMLDMFYRHGLTSFFTHAHGPVSRVDVMTFVQENRERLEEATAIGRGLKDLIPPSVGGVLWFLMAKADLERATAFFAGLKTGEDLPGDSPILAVRNRLVHAQAARHHRATTREVMTIMIRGWNAYVAGKPLIHVSSRATTLMIAGVPEVIPTPEVEALHAGTRSIVETYQPRHQHAA